MTRLEEIFSADGELSKAIPGYQPRSAQIEMALAIDSALENQQHLIAEAGTGTGKTFAYLIPAIVSEKKAIISTGTKNLQDQLFNNDIPIIRKALNIPFSAALLKGRSNYLCKYRLQDAIDYIRGHSKEDALALAKINRWAQATKIGDIAEMSDIAEGSPVWQQATSTVDNCLGAECSQYEECFLVKARRRAQDCDLLVVNHHLLCWIGHFDGGFGELLPDADIVVIDEAHQLADTASNFLGISISSKRLLDLADDTRQEYFKDATDMPALRSASEDLESEVKDWPGVWCRS